MSSDILPTVFHDPAPLLTPEAVAARLSVKAKTLERWRTTGEGPLFVRISRKVVRYRRQDVDAFIDARVVASTATQLC
jgi:predicted DNA-binding transcriptional regulator AlpA